MDDMDDLITRLRAAIDETERIAQAATAGPWRVNDETYAESIYGADDMTAVVSGGRWGGEASVFNETADALHIAAQNPDRTLRLVAAHRKILDRYEKADPSRCRDPEDKAYEGGYRDGLHLAVIAVAQGYGIEP